MSNRSDQVEARIRTFRELLNEYSEHTAIDWLRDVLIEAERESVECQRLQKRNGELSVKLIELSDEIERLRNI